MFAIRSSYRWTIDAHQKKSQRGVTKAFTSQPLHWLSFILFSLCLFAFHVSITSAHNYGKIYDILDSSYYCFRRLNQTHQIGCASNINGNYGIAKQIRVEHQEEDVEFISKTGADSPYVAVITVEQLTNTSLLLALKAIATERINGMLVLDVGRPSAMSGDRSCPNEFSSLYVNDPQYGHCRSQEAWNMPAIDHFEGMVYQDFQFPIFLLRNQTQIELMKKKISEHSTDSWPKLAVELNSPMHAAKDSVTCLRRSRMNARFNIYDDILCDPLGGNNIFHHTIDLLSTSKILPNSVVVLAVRQDSFSIFDGLAPGADSAISALVVTLAIAEMLNQPGIKSEMMNSKQKTLMYALFDGEAFDYIGSSDTVYSMQKNKFSLADPFRVSAETLKKFPSLNLTHLSHFIELNQLAQYDNQPVHQIYLHKNLEDVPGLTDLIQMIRSNAQGLDDLKINDIDKGHPLPPSSAQSFLKKRNDNKFTVMVATNHKQKYANKYYNSFYEDGKVMVNLDVLSQRLTSLATLFGKVLYQLVTGKTLVPTFNGANPTIVRGLLTCYLNDSNCALFQQVQDPTITPTSNKTRSPLNTYVSVYGVPNILREYTRLLLFRFTGEKVAANSSTECQKLANDDKTKQFNYLWQNGDSMKGECIKSSTYMVPTVTPAIDPDTLEMIPENFPEYSLWTESKWQTNSLRIFVLPSQTQKVLIVLLGVFILVSSFAVVYLLREHGSVMFGHSPRGNGVSIIGNGSSSANIEWNTTANVITEDGRLNNGVSM